MRTGQRESYELGSDGGQHRNRRSAHTYMITSARETTYTTYHHKIYTNAQILFMLTPARAQGRQRTKTRLPVGICKNQSLEMNTNLAA